MDESDRSGRTGDPAIPESRDVKSVEKDLTELAHAAPAIPKIELAVALAEAKPFSEDNISLTFRGLVQTEAGEIIQAVLKDLDVRELANELLGAALALAAGLPIPTPYLAIAPEEAFPTRKAPLSLEGDRLVFASSDKQVPSLRFRVKRDGPAVEKWILESLGTWPQLGETYAFDSWAANVDRNPGNLLLGDPGDVWVIDHGQAFTGPAWRRDDLQATGEFRHRLGEWLTPMLDAGPIDRALAGAKRFDQAAKRIDIDAVIESSHVAELLPSVDLDALRNFLRERIDVVGYYASKALGRPTLL